MRHVYPLQNTALHRLPLSFLDACLVIEYVILGIVLSNITQPEHSTAYKLPLTIE